MASMGLVDRAYFEGREFVSDSGTGEGFVPRFCAMCRAITQDYAATVDPVCFDCSHATNEYAAKGVSMSVDASCDDSANLGRIADGSHDKNMALPPVQGEAIGRDAYGKMRYKLRPRANNEIASARRLRELAKRANLSPLETARRAVGR
jgi:hypothetical protein